MRNYILPLSRSSLFPFSRRHTTVRCPAFLSHRHRWYRAFLLCALAFAQPCFAPPPLQTGDVPTADKGSFEWYIGGLYEKGAEGHISREWPATEIVYGLTERQELTLELSGLSTDHHFGLSDATFGTKYLFFKETERRPGISGSFDLKCPTGDSQGGLGSNEFDYDLRLRTQKSWGWFTAIGNIGYTFVTDPVIDGVRTDTENVWFLGFAQEYSLGRRTSLLSELFFVSREEPGEPHSLTANFGFKHLLRDNLEIHATIGRSVREDHRGGPDLLVYAGLKWEFDPFWKKRPSQP